MVFKPPPPLLDTAVQPRPPLGPPGPPPKPNLPSGRVQKKKEAGLVTALKSYELQEWLPVLCRMHVLTQQMLLGRAAAALGQKDEGDTHSPSSL